MCMYTSLVERTPGAGRQANFSSGVASASAINCRDTWRHSPSYPCQIPSGGACASKGRALNKRSKKSVFLMVYLPYGLYLRPAYPGSSPKTKPILFRFGRGFDVIFLGARDNAEGAVHEMLKRRNRCFNDPAGTGQA